MNCEAIKGYEVGRERGLVKSLPLPLRLGIPRCSHFIGWVAGSEATPKWGSVSGVPVAQKGSAL